MVAPLALRDDGRVGPLPLFDVERRRVDVTAMITWARDTLRRAGVEVDDLARLHEHVDAAGAVRLAQHLTVSSRSRAHRAVLFALLAEALPELERRAIVVQATSHFRVLVPGDERSAVPPHTDHGIGHPLDERNVWIALTDAVGPAALHLLSRARSSHHEATRAASGWVLPDVTRDDLEPIDARVGDVLLFTPVHVHGARPPLERTRVSIDVRIAPRHSALERHPSGYVALEAG